MEVKELIKAIGDFRKQKWNEQQDDIHPKVIVISHKNFDELASDKEAIKHLKLFDWKWHTFDNIPIIISNETETYRIE